MVLLRKHDGTYLMCIDFGKLSQCTQKYAVPLPTTDDVLEALGCARWFFCLDLALDTGKCKSRKRRRCVGHMTTNVNLHRSGTGRLHVKCKAVCVDSIRSSVD